MRLVSDKPQIRDITAELHLVGGPRPYLWVGEKDGRAFATFGNRRDLLRLANAITLALKRTRKKVSK